MGGKVIKVKCIDNESQGKMENAGRDSRLKVKKEYNLLPR